VPVPQAKGTRTVGKQTFLATGMLILVVGLAFVSTGAHKIITHLPMSEERAIEEAEGSLPLRQGASEPLREESARRSAEVEIWKSARGMINEIRAAERAEGVGFLLAGLILVVWGGLLLYNSRSTPGS
jgi:hypothetical protein